MYSRWGLCTKSQLGIIPYKQTEPLQPVRAPEPDHYVFMWRGCKTREPSDGAWTCLDEQTSGGAGVIPPTVPARNARRGECPNGRAVGKADPLASRDDPPDGSSRDGTSGSGMEPDGWLSDCLF